VLWKEVWRSSSGGQDSPSVPWLYYLAIDDGTGDRTRAWGLPVPIGSDCEPGDTVRIRVRRWSRRIFEMSLVERRVGRSTESDASDSHVETLVAQILPSGAAEPTTH
jgi:hypothetical protein